MDAWSDELWDAVLTHLPAPVRVVERRLWLAGIERPVRRRRVTVMMKGRQRFFLRLPTVVLASGAVMTNCVRALRVVSLCLPAEFVQHVRDYRHLEVLDMARVRFGDDRDMEVFARSLATLRRLRVLQFVDTPSPSLESIHTAIDQDAAAFASLEKYVRTLWRTYNNAVLVRRLQARLARLQTLVIDHVFRIPLVLAAAAAPLRLRHLVCPGEDFERLVPVRANSLSITSTLTATNRLEHQLNHCHHLTSLVLEYQSLEQGALPPHLTRLELVNCTGWTSLDTVAALPRLQALVLNGSAISPDSWRWFATQSAVAPRLKVLQVARCKSLCSEAFGRFTSLLDLRLVGEPEPRERACRPLMSYMSSAHWPPQTPSLRSLDVGDTVLGPLPAHIGHGLTRLDLSGARPHGETNAPAELLRRAAPSLSVLATVDCPWLDSLCRSDTCAAFPRLCHWLTDSSDVVAFCRRHAITYTLTHARHRDLARRWPLFSG